jgi:hypothetical protein
MHARIGILRALNRQVERVFNPDRPEGSSLGTAEAGERSLRGRDTLSEIIGSAQNDLLRIKPLRFAR